MTKVIIIGDRPDKTPKKILFKYILPNEFSTFREISDMDFQPQTFQNIELICRDYTNNLDLMFAYDEDRNTGVLYLGYFNDGII